MNYNYYEAVKDEVRREIAENYNLDKWRGNRDGLEDALNNSTWGDSSFMDRHTISTELAKERIFGDEATLKMMGERICENDDFEDMGYLFCCCNWVELDRFIRFAIYPSAISDALDEIEESGKLDDVE